MSQGNRATLLVVSPIPPGTRDDPVDMKKSVPHCHWVAFSCKYLQKIIQNYMIKVHQRHRQTHGRLNRSLQSVVRENVVGKW